MQPHRIGFPLRVPEIPPPQPHHAQAPMVYVYERQEWAYKVVVRNTADQELPSEHELNALGANGWELVGVVQLSGRVHFYFKRVRT